MSVRACFTWIALSAAVFVLGVTAVFLFSPGGPAEAASIRKSAFRGACEDLSQRPKGWADMAWLRTKLAGDCTDET